MSEGNTKCKLFGNCNEFTTADKCTTACNFYAPKNPDEEVVIPCALIGECNVVSDTTCNSECPSYSNGLEKAIEQEEKKSKNSQDVNLKLSGLEKFDKKHEFAVLKKHIFEFQSISPKKIILKYKRKLKETDQIADGCYVFTDRDDKLLEPHKVFAKFDRDAKAKQAEMEAKAKEAQEV